jgi:beta-galactosidase/beta-glucuronidase
MFKVKIVFLLIIFISAVPVLWGQKSNFDCENPEVFAVNKLALNAHFIPFENTAHSYAGEVEVLILNAMNEVILEHETTFNKSTLSQEFPIRNAKKGSTEDPNLYKLILNLKANDGSTETISNKIGFREVEIKNAQVLINGQSVFFKG